MAMKTQTYLYMWIAYYCCLICDIIIYYDKCVCFATFTSENIVEILGDVVALTMLVHCAVKV